MGEIMNHPGDFNMKRSVDEEFKLRDKIHESKVKDLRMAAECQRQTRKFAQPFMRPGIKLMDLCNMIEVKN